jgi:ATP-dependent Lhr-like helicase
VGGGLRGREGLVRAVEQLAGAVLPASALETLVLPSRVADYSPALLDELTSSGEVLWQGHGSLPGDDGWVSLHLADTAHLTLASAEDEPTDSQRAVLRALSGGGAFFFRTLSDVLESLDDEALLADLWSLVWAGRVAGDTIAPLRALLSGGRTAHRRSRTGPRTTRYAGRRGVLGALSGQPRPSRPTVPTRSGPPTGVGRWSVLPDPEPDATVRAYATAEVLLDRYGVLTRGSVVAENVPGGFAAVYRVLAAAEESGRVRRGYFVESLGASQFGSTGAVDRLRAGARPVGSERRAGSAPALVLAATDPANPFGAALPWPDREQPDLTSQDADAAPRKGHQPGRKAGALVVVVDGELVLYVERGGKTLLSWTDDPDALQSAADALALAVREGALGRLTVEKADGGALLGSRHPLVHALAQAGFHATPRGLRLRR